MAAYFLQRLNRIVDRLFDFELQSDELQYLADARKVLESPKTLGVRAPLRGLR
jgi:hypothetical protein